MIQNYISFGSLFSALSLAALTALTIGTTQAQTVLHQPQLGSGVTAALYGTTGEVLIPEGGENQVWDYGEHSGTFFFNVTVEPAGNSPFSASFPDADWLLSQPNYMGFGSLQDSTVEYGNVVQATLSTAVYDDPVVKWIWPVHYGDVFSDYYSMDTDIAGTQYVADGNLDATVDGWGTLYHPADTTYDEVLRITWSTNSTEVYGGDTSYTLYSRVDYYVDGEMFPVLLHEGIVVTDVDSTELYSGWALAWYGGYTLGLETADMAPLQLNVGPNPAVDMFTVAWDENRAPNRVQVLDMKGAVVAAFEANQCANGSLQVSNLPSGMYIVKGNWDDAERISRVIVQ
jgi:hypothetical protein